MQCPTDGATLVMSERSGIEIDYCPTCRGVWLDRGELDKILDRAADQSAPAPAAPTRERYDDRGHQQGYGDSGHRRPKRKESWLSDLLG